MRVETIEDVLLPGLNLKVRQLMAVDGNLISMRRDAGRPAGVRSASVLPRGSTADIGVRYPSYPSAGGG